MSDTNPEAERPFDPEAAAKLADYFRPGGFPGFTIEDGEAWTSQQVRDLLAHHRKFLRHTIEPSVDEVLRQLADAKSRSLQLAEASGTHRARIDELEAELAGRETEWTAGHPYEDGRPGLCTHGSQGERNARQMGANDGWTTLRRLVGPWTEVAADPDGPIGEIDD